VLALARRGSRRLIWAWALLALLSLDQDPWRQVAEYGRQALGKGELRSALRAIPEADAVSGTELAGPWIANRLRASRYPDLAPFGGKCPDWFVIEPGADAANLPCHAEVRYDGQGWRILNVTGAK
jgi:hypothetical protein